MKRNSIVLVLTLAVLALFAWAGWANWMFREQAAEVRLANVAKGELLVTAEAGQAQLTAPLKGKPAPAFSLETLDGKKMALVDLKGKAVLINFWATWCAPCKVETPWLIELQQKYAAEGLVVLGVSVDDLDKDEPAKLAADKKEIGRFVDQLHIPYPILIDGSSIANPYGGLDNLPASFYVDRTGTVVESTVGLHAKDEMDAAIRKALGI